MRSINVSELIDTSKINRFHMSVMFLCALILLLDGYDLVVYGVIMPFIMQEWGLTPIEAGAIGSYGMMGLILGAFIFGPLADKVGRKNVILFCLMDFSLFTALCYFSNGPTSFIIFRFLAGLGMGGIFPNIVALMTDYAPKKKKAFVINVVNSGFPLGGLIAAACGVFLLPVLGWKSLLLMAGIGLLLIPFIYLYLPDSPNFYVQKSKQNKLVQILKKVSPEYVPQSNDSFEISITKKDKMPAIKIFENGRVISTFMIWIIFFMTFLLLYFLYTWLPALMMNYGYPTNSSIMFLLLMNLGAILGALLGGWLSDRWSVKKVLTMMHFLLAVSFLLLALKPSSLLLLNLILLLAGTAIGASNGLAYIFASVFYPVNTRSTGTSWASGFGRIGSAIAPSLGGILLSMNYPFNINFLLITIPSILAIAAILLVRDKQKKAEVGSPSNIKKDQVGAEVQS